MAKVQQQHCKQRCGSAALCLSPARVFVNAVYNCIYALKPVMGAYTSKLVVAVLWPSLVGNYPCRLQHTCWILLPWQQLVVVQ